MSIGTVIIFPLNNWKNICEYVENVGGFSLRTLTLRREQIINVIYKLKEKGSEDHVAVSRSIYVCLSTVLAVVPKV